MEDFERYLRDIVRPTVAEFEEKSTSVRHAFIACVTVFHSVDYLAYPKKSRGTRQQFGKESSAFAMVDLLAHAFKHVGTTKRKGRLMASEVIERPPGEWGKMVWGLSRWGDAKGGVTLDNKRDVDVLHVVKEAQEFLEAKIKT